MYKEFRLLFKYLITVLKLFILQWRVYIFKHLAKVHLKGIYYIL